MFITIYFNDTPLYLCKQTNEKLDDLRTQPGVVYSSDISKEAVRQFINEVQQKNVISGILCNRDFETLRDIFFDNFLFIEAAGGIVQNADKEILFIFRKGKWDLPKGKLDTNEDAESCARREIEEETGVTGLMLKYKVGSTFHVYEEKGIKILKESHWFFYRTDFSGNLRPQLNEDITEAKWIPTRDIKIPMANSYATIRNIMHEFFDKP